MSISEIRSSTSGATASASTGAEPRRTRVSTDPGAGPPAGQAVRSGRASPPIVAGSGCSTPSSRFSRCARIAVIGVFSSCETLATRSRRLCSRFSSSPLIRLNAWRVCRPRPGCGSARAPSSRRSPSGGLPTPCRGEAVSSLSRRSAQPRARARRRPLRRGGTATTRSGGSRWSRTTSEESPRRRVDATP